MERTLQEHLSSEGGIQTEVGDLHPTSASADQKETEPVPSTSRGLPTEDTVKDRLGKKTGQRERITGPDRTPEREGKKSVHERIDHPADLRTRLLNLAHSFAVQAKDRPARDDGYVPVQYDVNTEFMHRQQQRRDKDPLLLSMLGKLPFAGSSKRGKKKSRKPSKSMPALGYAVLTAEEEENNPFVNQPRFHRRCEFCSSQHCSKSYRDFPDKIPCLKYRQQLEESPTRQVCHYIRCTDRASHHTSACEALHQKCSVCGMRGHGPQDKCDLKNSAIMDCLRADFEQFATMGYYTYYRKTELEWGWYNFTKEAVQGEELAADYVELTDMNVLDAIATVEAICLAAKVRAETKSGPDDNNNKDSAASPPVKRRKST